MIIKKMVLILLITGLPMFLFAYGPDGEYGKGNEEFMDLIESKETISLTGTVMISNRIFPELNTGNDLYKLMMHRYFLGDADITDNTEITVEGVALKVKQGVQTKFLNEGDEVLFVQKVVINGIEYNMEEECQCQGSCNGKQGRMGRRYNRGHQGTGFQGSRFNIFE